MLPTELEAIVADLVRPAVERCGCELFDVEWKAGLLRVSIDRDGGVDLDAIGEVSPAVGAVLDQEDPIPGRYTLEVSSPGLERPLRTAHHFRRSVGKLVSVKTTPDTAGERRLKGVLQSADDDGITVDGRRLAHAQVASAQTVFEWGPAPKPGGPKPKRLPVPPAAGGGHEEPDPDPQTEEHEA